MLALKKQNLPNLLLTLAVSVTATKYQFLIAGLEIMDSVWIVPFHDCHKLFPDHYKMQTATAHGSPSASFNSKGT